MATSNTRPRQAPVMWIALVLSLAFLLVMVVTILWVVRPIDNGYVLGPHTDNPTQITIGQ